MDFIYETGRIYAEDASGDLAAEITFPASNGIAEIDHTFVGDSLRGQGIAGQLVKAAAEQIIKDGNKIKATCPYAVSWLAKHKEYDVIS